MSESTVLEVGLIRISKLTISTCKPSMTLLPKALMPKPSYQNLRLKQLQGIPWAGRTFA